jgi:hypothetical protein
MQIEKGIPLPDIKVGRKPLVDRSLMEVGDSYFKKNAKANSEVAILAAWRKQKASSFKFAVRTVEGGIRVWRVA